MRLKRTNCTFLILWSVFTVFFILLSVTGCSLLSDQQTETSPNNAVETKLDSVAGFEELPSISQAHILEVKEIQQYIAALLEVKKDFNSLRPGGQADLEQLQPATLERVVDGDTLIVMLDGKIER